MGFNSIGQYSANHKVWDHVGNILPDIEHSEGERPAFPFHPAPWLPVKFYDKFYENWNVIMPGKILALDPYGYVMPAEYGLGGATVTYTANDVTAGVIDIATGVAVTTAKVVTLTQLNGTMEAGWTAALAGVANGSGGKTSGFMGVYGKSYADSTVKYPIGVAPYAYLQWAGGDGSNPANYTYHNFNMQHQVAVLCDYVLKLPVIPGQIANETVNKTTAGNLVIGTQGTHTRAQAIANSTGRYQTTTGSNPIQGTDTVIALALENYPVSAHTARTQFVLSSSVSSDNVSTVLVTCQPSIAAVRMAGDFYVDTEVGVVFIYSADGVTVPAAITGATGNVRITYYHYVTAPGVYSQFSCVLATTTELVPGDFLGCGAGSNWVRINPAAGSTNYAGVLGQVLGFVTEPQDGLDKVRTAYSPAINTSSAGSMANAVAGSNSANLGQMDQMPGSASRGYSDLITFAGAADTYCIVNVINR
jgi:hypothetical protein